MPDGTGRTELAFGAVATDQRWLNDVLPELDATRFDALYVVDHPAFPIPDPWTWLAYAAARTRRLRLGTHVTGAPFHHPTALAKQVATVDVLSGGRAVLGIGTAYEREDFEPYGFAMPDFAARVTLLDETLQLLVALWSGEKTEFEGAHFRYAGGAEFQPRPVQRPHPPLVIGLNRAGAALDVAARRADALNTWQLGPAQVAELGERAAEACAAAGRPPDALAVTADVLLARDAPRSGAEQLANRIRDLARSWGRAPSVTQWGADGVLHGDADAMAEQARHFAAVGVTELCVAVNSLDDAHWFSDEVIARLRG